MIIEISTHGCNIRRKRERFVIKMPEQKDTEIPAEKVTAILVSSNAMISTAAIKLCIERQIQFVITSWYGKPIARMWSSTPGRQTQIRRQQYLNYETIFAYTTTKEILIQKLSKQKRLLIELKQNRTDVKIINLLGDAISFFNKIIASIQKITYTKNFAARFLGFEGSCAVRYFSMISLCLPKKWQFSHRTQNPGLDAFNASLNYLYGIAYSDIEKIIILSGLDPTAGFYHKDNYAKPTLVFDLIEPHRPIADKALMYLFTKKIAKDTWFSNTTPQYLGIEITKIGKQALITQYRENCQKTIEKNTWQQCRKITEELLNLDKLGRS